MVTNRVLYITDRSDPLTDRVLAAARDRLEIEMTDGSRLPGGLERFDALLVGDVALAEPLTDLSTGGPKLVQLTRGHHVDVDARELSVAGVIVAGASPILAEHVASHALALSMAVLSDGGPRGLRDSDALAAAVTNGSDMLAGKTVGVVGFGRVGQAMARLSHKAGATVIYADVRTASHGSTAESEARRSTLDLLLSNSDVVSLHVQWGPTSDPLITERELRLMPRGAALVNTADARLVDVSALTEALESGRVRAGLDIEEPAASALENTPNSVVTPYVSARSEIVDADVAEFAVSNIEAALASGDAGAPVDPKSVDGRLEIIDFPRAGDPAFWSSKMAPRSAD